MDPEFLLNHFMPGLRSYQALPLSHCFQISPLPVITDHGHRVKRAHRTKSVSY